MRLLLTWACNVASIFVASVFVDGIDYGSKFWYLLIAGLVFGLVNFLLKPVVKLLALPVVIITFGVALFLINILMLYITTWIVGPFEISSFRSGVAATIVIWLVNAILGTVFGLEDREKRKREAKHA